MLRPLSSRFYASLMKKSWQQSLHSYIQSQWLRHGLVSWLLLPLSGLMYISTTTRRLLYRLGILKSYRAPLPVIVVGNIFVGGTGKTPLTIALVQALRQHGWHIGVISRGYGVEIGPEARTAYGPSAQASEVGDEPSLIAAYVPVAVHPNRRLAIEKLMADYPLTKLIIADDGLQHLALQRDLEIVVQDNRRCGNGLLLPAGPLREAPSRLKTVDYIVTNLKDRPTSLSARANAEFVFEQLPAHPSSTAKRHKPSFTQVTHSEDSLGTGPQKLDMWLEISELEQLSTGISLTVSEFLQQYSQTKLYAIAGIGQPERFFTSLREQGIFPSHTQGFADHHAFQAKDFHAFHDGVVLMTSKDASKCRAIASSNLWVVHVQAQFSDPHFFQGIDEKLRQLPLY